MTPVLELQDVSKSFTLHLRDQAEIGVVRNVSFKVDAGECVVLSGPSGAGKSSILKMIFGNYRCDAGSIGVRHHGKVVDKQIGALPEHQLRSWLESTLRRRAC